MARVAVDAMGGDHAPHEIVAGAVRAHRELGIEILLTGREPELKQALAACDVDVDQRLQIVAADDVIEMHEADPARAVRRRRDSSVSVACRLVREGRADAAFSAGATGASLAAAVLEMRRVRGVQRPAVTLHIPFQNPTVLLDVGASSDVRPEHLAGFAVLGSVFARARLGIGEPRVGLLSIGEEAGKGNELTRAAYPLVESSGVNFIGNVEGHDLPTGRVDVVVTDGFTGNVMLKLMEGFYGYLFDQMSGLVDRYADQAAGRQIGTDMAHLRRELDPDQHGGAQLLGVDGVCIIGHGSSNAQAVFAALRVASQTVESGFVEQVVARLARRHE